ncbi:MAG: HAMP domain-containing protein [Deltaproteobacteria bacterium]|nr:HAMP domain-containing protein [Deltaproteobacteria bacterium]
MNIIRGLSIKNFLMGIVGLLVLILGIQSGMSFYTAYVDSKEIERTNIANRMADHVLTAAGEQAKERGFTATAIGAKTNVNASLLTMIKEARIKGNAEFAKALVLAKTLMDRDSENELLKTTLTKQERIYSEVESARAVIDNGLGKDITPYPAQDWVKLMTSLIETGAELRLATLTTNSGKRTLQEAMRLNLELKQAIWLVSEYSGRERAAIGNAIASRKPLDQPTLERLASFRAIVDLNLKPILRLKETPGVDREILTGISRMEEIFLGTFDKTRHSVYGAAQTAEYPVTTEEWIKKSTEGIDSTLAVSTAISRVVDAKYADLAASKRNMIISTAVFSLIICLGLVSLWIIKNKVVTPLRHLNGAINEIEKTGDLTLKVNVNSADESGQIAETFNRMMTKFHAIIREIHSSTEALASSSEQLSASATQIAGGSKNQGMKAAQVSTASQEMSATIIEVAKNVSSAADAAREASAVAVKGGSIVTKTIESMSGIASTAKESSAIISALGSRSKDIGNIIGVIDDIADQTNLLALNAAIEAARAGEQGRGFAVVADEVRKLAEKTMMATKEISAVIKTMQNETDRAITSVKNEVDAVASGVNLAKDAGAALGDIVSKVDVVTQMVHQITTAMEEQSAVTEQITGDIESVAGVINETTESSEQIANASEEMARLAVRLKSKVEEFKVSTAEDLNDRAAVKRSVLERIRPEFAPGLTSFERHAVAG